MDSKTEGAWILHHKRKLDEVSGVENDYSSIIMAGKCSTLLSAISQTNQAQLSKEKIKNLAKAVNINCKLELPAILSELKRQKMIDSESNTVEVLGLTSSSILENTTKIFSESEPSNEENAVLKIAEKTSDRPFCSTEIIEFISDSFQLTSNESKEVLSSSKKIGFIDYETLGDKEILFNGNLFRNSDINKTTRVLETFSVIETKRFQEINELLNNNGCVPLEEIIKITGTDFFNKIHSIGLVDVNTVSNDSGEYYFATKPSSFCKFSKSIIDDAFDLAKAFVTSLTFGMVRSSSSRGQITMIEALMSKLINGQWVGPATAIGQDYKILELKGVIQLQHDHNNMYKMKLLKKDVGQLALAVIQDGNTTNTLLETMPGASIANYIEPEKNRTIRRKNLTAPLKHNIGEILDNLRTGSTL